MEIDLGVAVHTTYADGYLGVQPDGYGEELSGLDMADAHHPYGFIGRPLDQGEDGQGAIILRVDEGGAIHAYISEDPRDRPRMPALPKGSSAQYSAHGQFALLDASTGIWTVYLPNLARDKAQVISCNPEAGTVAIVNVDGASVTMADGNAMMKSPNGQCFISVTNDGITLSGPVSMPGGAVVGNPVTAVPVLVGLAALAGVPSLVFKASATP